MGSGSRQWIRTHPAVAELSISHPSWGSRHHLCGAVCAWRCLMLQDSQATPLGTPRQELASGNGTNPGLCKAASKSAGGTVGLGRANHPEIPRFAALSGIIRPALHNVRAAAGWLISCISPTSASNFGLGACPWPLVGSEIHYCR
jgi:hypothetical protein